MNMSSTKTLQARLLTSEDILVLADGWESLVKRNPASGFMQSLEWARFKRTQKLTTVHIGVFDAGVLIGGAIFHTADGNKGAGFMVAPDGPVLPWQDEALARSALHEIVACAETYARENGHIAIRIQPRLSPPAFAGEFEFGRAPVDLTPKETLFLNLSQAPEILLTQMKPKTRYNLRVAAKHGVIVTEETSADALSKFQKLMLEAASRDGFYVEQPSFFQGLVATLAPSGMIRLFFAEHDGDTLGTLMLLIYGNRATYIYGGISNHKRNVMAGYLLQWHAIEAAQKAGVTEYDFYGFDQFGSPTNSYAKFSRFKRGFGGNAVRYIGAQDYFFLDSLADVIVKAFSEVAWADEESLYDVQPVTTRIPQAGALNSERSRVHR